MAGFEIGIVFAQGQAVRLLQGLLETGGQFVKLHNIPFLLCQITSDALYKDDVGENKGAVDKKLSFKN